MKKPVKAIVYSTNLNHPFYIGHQYLRTSLTNLSDKEIEEFLVWEEMYNYLIGAGSKRGQKWTDLSKKFGQNFGRRFLQERSNFIGQNSAYLDEFQFELFDSERAIHNE